MSNLAKQFTAFNPDKPLNAQYGYNPKNGKRQALGPGEHYVYPDIFGAGTENGLVRGAGVAVAAAGNVNSQFLDLSGWQKWTIFYNFAAVLPAGGVQSLINIYADPGFNNLIGSYGAAFAAGLVFASQDSQQTQINNQYLTPYLNFTFANVAAVPVTFTASLFCYSYPGR